MGNLKTVRNHQRGFLLAVENNRRVSLEKGQWVQVQPLTIPDEGLKVWLRDFGYVKLFRIQLKDQRRHYVVHLLEGNSLAPFQRQAFLRLQDLHWQIEPYHRVLKQICRIECFQVRGKIPLLNHVFAALYRDVHLQQRQVADLISSAYLLQRDLFQEVIAAFIRSFIPGKEYLNPQFQPAVNA